MMNATARNALNSFTELHLNRLEQEMLANNPNINEFNTQIREGLSEDPADEEEHDPMLTFSLFGESDEPTAEELDLARRQDDAIAAMNTRRQAGEITATPHADRPVYWTWSEQTRPGHRVMINTDRLSEQYERELAQQAKRKSRPNPVFNPRVPAGDIPAHLQKVAQLNATARKFRR